MKLASRRSFDIFAFPTDGANAAFVGLMDLSPQWMNAARPAIPNEDTQSKDTVESDICLAIIFEFASIHPQRFADRIEHRSDYDGVWLYGPDSSRKATTL